MTEQLFEANVQAIMSECSEVFRKRGHEYSDTWRNAEFNALRATRALLKNICFWSDTAFRAIAAASFVDIKIARLAGGYKEDTALDLVNYLCYWASEVRELQKEIEEIS